MRSWVSSLLWLPLVVGACGSTTSAPATPATTGTSASSAEERTPEAAATAATEITTTPEATTPDTAPPAAPEATDTTASDTTAADTAATDTTASDTAAAETRTARPESTSIGSPTYGELRGGMSLPERAPGLESNPRRPNATAHFGTHELVDMLVRAAAVVDRELPGGTLLVNDIGFETGGPIDHHGSHQAGRDVDVLFYLLDRDGDPIRSVGAPLDPAGEGHDYRDLLDPADDVFVRLDAPRTWRFVRAILEDDEAHVQRIFVVEHLRTLLLAEAARARAPRAIVARFADVTCQPAYAHDDHLHVRLFCALDDIAEGCADLPPIYPWREAELEAAEVTPTRAQVPRRRRSRVVTEAEVRASEPPMHPDVRAFLDRRASWTTMPHPGRRYCR